MKNLNILFIAGMLAMATSCKKDNPAGVPVQNPIDTGVVTPPPTDPVVPPLADTARVLLKDIVRSSLPSPYYHFVYDTARYASEISFASGLVTYKLTYENRRLVKMLNTINGNQMVYTYSNGKVSLITERNVNGTLRWQYRFEYNTLNQLTVMEWIEYSNGVTGSPFKKMTMSYRPDGNLDKTERYFRGTNGQLEWTNTTEYKDYDNTINVDDFSIPKDFFESLLYLPQVKLQKNNHHTEISTGVQSDYKVTYTYQTVNGLPVTQNGVFVWTRGTNVGQTINISSQYTYY